MAKAFVGSPELLHELADKVWLNESNKLPGII